MEIFLISLLVIIASSIGTITGFGASTLMVPVLVLFYPLPQVLLFVGIVHWFVDLWKILLFRNGTNIKLLLSFGIPGIVTSIFGASLILTLPRIMLHRMLGVFLLLYVLFLILDPKSTLKKNIVSAATGGALSGFFAGLFGMGGIVRSAFLSAYNLPKEIYLFLSGSIGIIEDSSRIITYIGEGIRVQKHLLLGLLIFIPVSLFGAFVAKHIVHHIPQNLFRLVVAIFLLLIGVKLFFFPV